MTATLILWSHALAALLFGSLALSQWRRPAAGLPRRAFAIALTMTALWALAVAGIDARDLSARIAESARNIAWLALMFALVRRNRAAGYALGSVYAVVMLVAATGALIAIVSTVVVEPEAVAALTATRLLLRMMTAVSALVLVHQLNAASEGARGGIRLIALALAAMWSIDLLVFAVAYLSGWPSGLIVLRGVVMIGVGSLLGIAATRGEGWSLALSRKATMRTLGGIAVALYVGIVALVTGFADMVGGENTRLIQTAIVFGAATAFLTFASTPWLRAWTKVKIAKHLFRHRYDYREEWQRFTDTLGQPGEGAAPLGQRVVKAIADLTDSPSGLLLSADGQGLSLAAEWEWAGEVATDAALPLAQHLAATGRIVELDAIRAGTNVRDADLLPEWLLAMEQAWAVVPLIHLGQFVGAIVLARPPVDRALDWEDFDLLRVAGRQAASFLAEDKAHAALADAARFDEFNRRFAFIMHDLKNLVSQLTLVARNAERHADNPDFRADMVATLQDSAGRMNALLARLSQHHGGRAEAPQPVDVGALADRIAQGRRAQHPIDVRGEAAMAFAQPARLEQAIGHLVQNAIEASGDRRVAIDVGIVDGRIAIDVIDEGQGMSAAFVRDRLFRPFASTKPGGFGIGAFETRQLIEGMGGRVEVTSREGEGTRFRIMLPPVPALEVAA